MTHASIISADKNKGAAGGVCCWLWILTGVYYFATTPEAHFISWQALVFFVGGAFLSALVLGAATYYLFEAHRKYVYRPRPFGQGLALYDLVSMALNIALNILQFVVPVAAAHWSFRWLFGID